jgi:ammonia channel protein AmtB
VVPYYAAIIIGLFAGVVYVAGSKLLIYLKLDDAVDGKFRLALTCHLVYSPRAFECTYLF